MAAISIKVPVVEVHIHADRRLAFQVITAFGAPMGTGGASSRVLSEEDGGRLVEFRTPVRGLLGGSSVFRTVEWVTVEEPETVDFRGVEGPLPLLHDRFTLEAEGGCTRLRYQSEFGVKGWVAGWLIGVLYVRPKMKRFIQAHVQEMKETIEARAVRSKRFPQQACSTEAA